MTTGAAVNTGDLITAAKMNLKQEDFRDIDAIGILDQSGAGTEELRLVVTENLGADRILTLTVNNAARTIDLTGNLTIAGDLTTTVGNVAFAAAGGGSSVTLPATGTLATLTGTETLSGKTLTLAGSPLNFTAAGTFTMGTTDNFALIVRTNGVNKFAFTTTIGQFTVYNTSFNHTLIFTDPAAARNITFGDAGGHDSVAYLAATQSLSGKTLSLSGNLTLASALDLVIQANTTAAFEISDATTKYFALDSRTATDGVAVNTWTVSAPTFASANGSTFRHHNLAAYTLTLTGGVQVTALSGLGMYLGAPTVTSAAATTVVLASNLYVAAPVSAGAGPASFTAGYSAHFASQIRVDGNISLANAAYDIVVIAATAAALEISDGTTKYLAIDTRVATTGVITHALDISDYTFASAAGAVATGLSLAAHTLNLTGNTQVTSQADTAIIGARTIAADGVGGACTVDEANTLLLVAPTEGANVTMTAASALRILNAGGTPVNQYGIYIEDLTVGATADYGIFIAGADTAAIWVNSADPIHVGLAGTATGKFELSGATSGTVTLTVAATAGTWTMTLPAAVGGVGEQLTDAAGNGICSWAAAASVRELKENISPVMDSRTALDKILNTQVYQFNYREGKGTSDTKTQYLGVMADEAPWAMHYQGRILNPVNTFGYTLLAIQALKKEIRQLQDKVAELSK